MKKLFLFCLVFLSFTQTYLAQQCTNPTPTGPATQEFCKTENKTVGDLIPIGSNIVWYAQATGGLALNNLAILTSGTYYADDRTLGGCSVSRLEVEVSVYGNLPDTFVSITECTIDTPTIADLYADGVNIEWFDAEVGGNQLNATDLLQNGITYWAQQTENGCVSKRSKTTVTLLDPSPPLIPNNPQTFCDIENPTIANLVVQLNNPSSTVLWYATETASVAVDTTEQLVNGTTYWASEVEGALSCESSLRTSLTVIINTTPAPTTSTSNLVFCDTEAATIADLQMVGTAIKWYDTATATTALNETDFLTTGDYYATQTDAVTGCESVDRTVVNVVVNSTAAPTTNEKTQLFCTLTEALVSNLEVSGTNIKWYESATATSPLNPTDSLIDGEDYFATQTDDTTGCESGVRTKVTVVFTVASAPTTSSAEQTFCASDLPTLARLEVVGTTIKWYDSLTSTTPLDPTTPLENGVTYFATDSNSSGCESENRLEITVNLTMVEMAVLETNGGDFCLLDGDFTVFNLDENLGALEAGNTVVWYDSYPNGNILSLSDLLVHNTIYYAVVENMDGCKSLAPLEVLVDLEACDDKEIEIYDGFSPDEDGTNDVFTIKNINFLYPDYTIDFYNRWGNTVYKGNANKPFWNGRLNGDGELLPNGIYFYVLNFNKNDKKPLQGRLYLSR